jgi:hypothetical protein
MSAALALCLNFFVPRDYQRDRVVSMLTEQRYLESVMTETCHPAHKVVAWLYGAKAHCRLHGNL